MESKADTRSNARGHPRAKDYIKSRSLPTVINQIYGSIKVDTVITIDKREKVRIKENF